MPCMPCNECGRQSHPTYRCPLRSARFEEGCKRGDIEKECQMANEILESFGEKHLRMKKQTVLCNEEGDECELVKGNPEGRVSFSKRVSVTCIYDSVSEAEAPNQEEYVAALGIGSHARERPVLLSSFHRMNRFIDMWTLLLQHSPPPPPESICFDSTWPTEDKDQFIKEYIHGYG
eukprot:TRINITY_DN3976_c7_g1_i1.p1 TRINITY_DN3976_c7_g1~~TRINITY_DN3976_c7_g1_i1.p1  ORF type:complete len:186 (+),score=15.18 TRINITY_DN3976_c7_g1_i1:33-560(+)